MRLPGVKKIAEKNGDRSAGENLTEYVVIRQMNKLAAQADDQNQLNQIIDHQPEKSIPVLAHEPGRSGSGLTHENETLP